MLKLDLGAGSQSPEGYTPLGNAHGSAIYPLPYGDGTVQAIRASHVLEHFPYGEVPKVLADWVRTLEPGGILRIAVPDFEKIAKGYLDGALPAEGYVMGGQIDLSDFHMALFDEGKLKTLLAGAGLVMIRHWKSELSDDGAALPISLNLEGVKPFQSEIAVQACMSIPRLAFADHAKCAFEALPSLKIGLRQYTGAYWGQCLERCLESVVAEEKVPDAILTLDYDAVFTRRDVSTLMQLMMVHPEVDAIVPIQAGRGKIGPLFTMDRDGVRVSGAPVEVFAGDLTAVSTGHFGLTLLRTEKLKALPKPWFHDVPSANGDWGDGHVDADIAFWRKWTAAGNSLFIANRVVIGHIEIGVLWPGEDLRAIQQPIGEWREHGAPKDVWK